ncbi:DUF1028 domain-containing protein [Pseudoclavibacter sp. AY1F1]|uniref:DUF1028 domain-containing protein n=1 Tax=Pseudoclavibacter sp. AY1F1 TaxID=2080583 RepID=UPI000CE7DD56|nr:DUF1028 domain-containing protein [Pseudoclavibacter sp. AY1F1]PPF43531.1 DUF1028 domain-containing protein [Pseudoclavibacter sp. AY1F1]
MTFTLLALDRAAGLLGAVTASRSLAVGNAVLAIDPAVGAVASQAWTNRALRGRMLDALAAGESPEAVVRRVTEWDEQPELRQTAVLDLTGRTGAWVGSQTSAWTGQRQGLDYVTVGNLLTGQDVLDAVADSFERGGAEAGDSDTSKSGAVAAFARRLIAALQAGQGAGGDARGRQSAAVLVARRQELRAHPAEFAIDLRVDDHPHPVAELERLLELRIRDLDEDLASGARAAVEPEAIAGT